MDELRTASFVWGPDATTPQKAWVNALRPGDVIQLIPFAFYMGWVNVVQEAHIEIEFIMDAEAAHASRAITIDNSAQYTMPLHNPSRNIRLLELDPGEYETDLSARFLRHRLMDDQVGSMPNFHAMSYCWDRGENLAHILLRQPTAENIPLAQWFTVQRNVYEALKRLRRRHEPLRIWIDALCINQSDEDERAKQVSIIGEIYSRAQETHIWLGEDELGVKAALRFIRDAYNYNEGSCPGAASCTCIPTGHMVDVEAFRAKEQHERVKTYKSLHELFRVHRQSLQADVLTAFGIRENSQEQLELTECMSSFFCHPWFGRSWVLQEALLVRQAYVHCGNEVVDWKEVLAVNSYLNHRQFRFQAPHLGPQICMPRVWASLRDSEGGDKGPRGLKRRLPILEVLLDTLDMKATDPRDRLYALLSFASEASPNSPVPAALRPNYEEGNSTRCVFANLTRWEIHHYKSLAILSTVHCQPTRTWQRTLCDLDSRIIDPLPTPSWSFGIEGESRWLNVSLQRQFTFKAGGSTTPNSLLLSPGPGESYLLRLRGVRLATITDIRKAPIGPAEMYEYDGTDRTDSTLVTVFDRLFDLSGTAGHWNWISSPVIDCDPGLVTTRFQAHCASHWTHAKQPRKAGAPERLWTLPDCVEDCFFTTSESFHGLCPWAAQIGDLIVLLYGGDVPYLLRLRPDSGAGDHYCLVGECYVNDPGVMHGSYMNSLIEGMAVGEDVTEVFILE